MLKIEIGDPQTMDKVTLRAVSAFLLTLAGDTVPAANVGALEVRLDKAQAKRFVDTVRSTAAELAPMPAAHPQLSPSTIAAEDKPDAGAPTTIDAAQAFGNLDKTVDQAQAAAVFGNMVPANPSPAEAFGNQGNAPAPVVPSPTASGAANVPAIVQNTNNAPASSGVEVDRDGYPWDARIHASSKVTNADGRWRMKRGVDDAFVAQVQAELRQIAAIPTPTAGAIAAAVQAASVPVPNVPDTATSTTAIAPSAAGNVPVPPAPVLDFAAMPSTATPANPMDYATFIGKVTAGLTSNPPTLSQVTLQGTLSAHGIAGLPVLATRPDLVPTIAAALGLA
jgi:hypothetical protein